MSRTSSTASSSSEEDSSGVYASVKSDQSLISAESGSCNQPFLASLPPPYQRKESRIRRPCLRNRTLVFISLCFSTLCVCLFLVCGIVYFCNRGNQVHAEPVPQYEEVCMPCDEIRPNPLSELISPLQDLLDIKRGYQDDGDRLRGNALDVDLDTDICCARTPAQYAALFKLILNRQEEVKRLAEVLAPQQQPALPHREQHIMAAPPPALDSNGDSVIQAPHNTMAGLRETAVEAAHFVLKPQRHVMGNEHHVQQWKSVKESPLSYVRGTGLVFQDNNKIIVRTPGLYFIYCQILFSQHSPAPADVSSSPPITSSYVMRHSLSFPASSGILLKARHSSYKQDLDRHSSYVGGLFLLHKGDQLYVKVSHPAAVAYDSRGSFFGLFKVGA